VNEGEYYPRVGGDPLGINTGGSGKNIRREGYGMAFPETIRHLRTIPGAEEQLLWS
jgi:hypothetical protein